MANCRTISDTARATFPEGELNEVAAVTLGASAIHLKPQNESVYVKGDNQEHLQHEIY